MSNEVSTALATYAASLQRDYPSWNAYVALMGSPPEKNTPYWVRLTVESVEANDNVRKYEDGDLLDVTFSARFSWRAVSQATDTALEIFDRAATFIAWLRVVDNARPRARMSIEPTTSPYNDAGDIPRREVNVRWTMRIPITTEYTWEDATEGPPAPPSEPVGTPIRNIILGFRGEDRVYPQ